LGAQCDYAFWITGAVFRVVCQPEEAFDEKASTDLAVAALLLDVSQIILA
jgi:hypothetical protein